MQLSRPIEQFLTMRSSLLLVVIAGSIANANPLPQSDYGDELAFLNGDDGYGPNQPVGSQDPVTTGGDQDFNCT